MVELIGEEIRNLEKDSWIVNFTWVKAHDNNYGNELPDQLAKVAASDDALDITYNKRPESAVMRTKRIGSPKVFPKVKDRLAKRLQMCLHLSTKVTDHGKLRAYLNGFKINDVPMCPCKMNPQPTDHLIRQCASLSKQRQSL